MYALHLLEIHITSCQVHMNVCLEEESRGCTTLFSSEIIKCRASRWASVKKEEKHFEVVHDHRNQTFRFRLGFQLRI